MLRCTSNWQNCITTAVQFLSIWKFRASLLWSVGACLSWLLALLTWPSSSLTAFLHLERTICFNLLISCLTLKISHKARIPLGWRCSFKAIIQVIGSKMLLWIKVECLYSKIHHEFIIRLSIQIQDYRRFWYNLICLVFISTFSHTQHFTRTSLDDGEPCPIKERTTQGAD